MAAFEYAALDVSGKIQKGISEGDTAKSVRQSLRDRGLTPVEVTLTSSESSSKKEKKRGQYSLLQRGISKTELALLTRQLATLVQAALPLEEVLQSVAEQSEKQRIKSMMYAVRARVLEGHTLAAGLAEYPKIFDDLYRATVSAGEQSGHLDTVLERLADYTENQQELESKVRQALIYPAFLSFFAIIIVIFLMTNIVPKVVNVFDDIGKELPDLTVALISLSNFFTENATLIVIACFTLVIFIRYLLSQPNILERYHALLIRTPLIKKLVKGLNAALFTRTFSILSGSGVNVIDAMKISAEVVRNIPMRKAILQATDRVREGSSIKNALAKEKLFPPMTMQLIASGENSGELEQMLDRAALQLEREQVTLIAYIVGILEPAIILIMGLMVLLIVLGILLPIFDLNTLVR